MADILIRGMENIPVGQEFVIVENIDFERYLYNRETGAAFHLVPLPEGHWDLIDRDAFRSENGLNAKCEHCPTNTYECQRDMIHTKMEFCGMLDDAPVIVPAEGGTENDP